MGFFPIKLRARNSAGRVSEVLCDTLKQAKDNEADLRARGFTVTAENNDGQVIDLSKLNA